MQSSILRGWPSSIRPRHRPWTLRCDTPSSVVARRSVAQHHSQASDWARRAASPARQPPRGVA